MQSRGLVPSAVAPDGVHDTGQTSSQGRRRDPFAATFFDFGCPERERIRNLCTAEHPRCLREGPADARRTGFGDGGASFAFGARVFARNEAQVTLDGVSAGKASDLIERGNESDRCHGTDSRNRHQALTDGVLARQGLELRVG